MGNLPKPECPRGCRAPVAQLAGTDSYKRYQCGNIDCLHEWGVPIEGRQVAPEVTPDFEEDDSMGKPKLVCQFGCGHKPFTSEKWKERHEKTCFKKGDGSVEETPDLPASTPEAVESSKSETPARTAMGSIIESLKNKRESVIRDNEEIQKLIKDHPEVRKIDAAIKLLESVEDV